jgi:hypothetical protein
VFINTDLEGMWKEMVVALIEGWTIPGRQVALATKVLRWRQIFVVPIMELVCVTL